MDVDVDVKEEPFDPNEEIIKTEPDPVSDDTDGYWCSTKLQTFKNDHEYALSDTDNMREYPTGLVNLDDIKQDISECKVPKIEQSFEFPENIEYDESLNTIKKETGNTNELKTADISDIKPVVSELLTSHCDIPTLKSEDYFEQPCSSEQTVIKTRSSVCEKNYSSSQSRSNQTSGHFKKYPVIYCPSSQSRINQTGEHFINQPVISKTQLVTHTTNTDVKLFCCSICSREFNRKSNLKQHLLIHSNQKPFICAICNKEFNLKSNLATHLIKHTNLKPFKCDICSKGFNHKSILQKHLLIHSNKKAFKCNICSKKFFHKYNLQMHLITHTNEKLFQCNICSKKFKRKCNLQKHIAIHSDKKPFQCDICFKEFNQKSNLRKHLIIHTNEKPFKCDTCSTKFTQKSSLQRHLNHSH
ncbi:unnamed protein product [Psylliodes chrysocephalus]|uniref:C2H2-type domain-containing protein n=1 Tax=Psylliodes chrysocephalus TaxID=3402493 RepID=A0A9P0DA91_9CUCU|nr:unnamed protein product [Psylliodes chrysocephala]